VDTGVVESSPGGPLCTTFGWVMLRDALTSVRSVLEAILVNPGAMDLCTVNGASIYTSVCYEVDSAARLATTLLPLAVISYTWISCPPTSIFSIRTSPRVMREG
jgi:hypothetical protein